MTIKGNIRIIFLSYINRSGSTYLSNILGQNNEICSLPEAEILIDLLLSRPEKKIRKKDLKYLIIRLIDNPKLKYWGIDQATLKEIITKSENKTSYDLFYSIILEYLKIHKPRAKIALFKGTKLLDLYSKLSFYKNRGVLLISIVRDGRASYASQKKSLGSLTGLPMSKNLLDNALHWNKFVRNILSGSFYLKYERLIEFKEETIQDVFDKIGIDEHNEIDNTYETSINIPVNQQHLHKNINKPPDSSRIHSWTNELSNLEIDVYNFICNKYLNRLKYNSRKKLSFKIIISLLKLGINRLFIIKLPLYKGLLKKKARKLYYFSPYA